MKRFTSAYVPLVLVMALALALAACTGASAQPRGAVIILWHSLAGREARALAALIDQWNARTHTGNTIIVPEYRSAEDLHNGLLNLNANTSASASAAAALPTLMLVQPAQAALYHQRNLLASLEPFINSPQAHVGWTTQDMTNLYPMILRAGRTPRGELIGIPMGGRARVLLMNRDRLRQAGIAATQFTWQSFGDTCNVVTDRRAERFCFAMAINHQTLEDWVLSNGATLISGDGTLMQANSPAATESMGQILRYLQTGLAFPLADPQAVMQQFANGSTTFAFAWSDEIDQFREAVRAGENFDWVVTGLPHANDATTPEALSNTTTAHAPLWVILNSGDSTTGGSARAHTAWQFVRWMLDTAQSATWARVTRGLPASISATQHLGKSAGSGGRAEVDAQQIAAFEAAAPRAAPPPLIGGWPCVQEALSGGMRQIFESRPISETLQNMQLNAQAQLEFDCALR